MANFSQHRTQVAIKQAVNNPTPEKIYSIDYISLITKSKDQIVEKLSKKYEQKLENETKNLRQQLEGQY